MSQAQFDLLCEDVKAGMEQLRVPGVAVGVIHEGQEYTAGFGVTNINHPLPVDADTLFQIGSTTKTFTATIIMQLVEKGLIDLDTPLIHYLPDLKLPTPEATAQATTRHLLTHTGGWDGDFFKNTGSGDDAIAKYVELVQGLNQITPAGQLFAYNNAGFILAGRLVEVITGKSYETVAKEKVFDPLGMSMSFFFPQDTMVHRVAVGHLADDQPAVRTAHYSYIRNACPAGGGGIVSSVKDQLRYARFHLSDGSPLLSQESMNMMQTQQVKAHTMTQGVGLSWLLREVGGLRCVQHGGATSGQMSQFVMVPEKQFAITVLTNADSGRRLGAEIVTTALKHYFGVEATVPVPAKRTDAELARYAGTYDHRTTIYDIRVEAGELVIQPTFKPEVAEFSGEVPTVPPVRFQFYDEDKIVGIDGRMKGQVGEFITTPENAFLALGGRLVRRC